MIKENETVTAIKGFNTDWTCRGFQYEIGQTYEHDGPVVRCAEGGFHAIEGNPLGVFKFYPPGTSNYATVELSGKIARDESDGKIAAGRITITAELFLPSLVQKGVDWILANISDEKKETNTGDRSAATNTGYQSAATNTGDESAATVEGNSSVAIATGYQGRAKASAGSAIVVCERKINGKLIGIFSGIAGQGGIKPDVWYTAKDGKLIEAEENKNV